MYLFFNVECYIISLITQSVATFISQGEKNKFKFIISSNQRKTLLNFFILVVSCII